MTCKTCQFWVTLEPGGVKDRNGHCRRFPPQITTRVYTLAANENHGRSEPEVESSTVTEWPQVKDSDWCGEFSKQPEKSWNDL